MKTTLRNIFGALGGVLMVLLFAVGAAQAQEEQSFLVKEIEIRHVGPVPISDSVILANVRVKAGQTTTKTSLGQDVRSLYTTGYFTNVNVSQEDVEGGIKVVFTVQGKPKIKEIIVQGNKRVKASRVRKEIDFKVGEPLDERKVVVAQKKIEEYYEKAGFEQAKINYDISVDRQTGQGVVTFRIDEGPRVEIIDITFTGNDHFKKPVLQKQMKTKRKWWLSWIVRTNVMKKEQWQDDLDKLRDFYHNEGYIDVQLKDVKFDYVTPTQMFVRINVIEGKKYLVGKIDFKGNQLFPSAGIREKLRMIEGKTFGPRALDKDIEGIRDYYGAKGYIDAQIVPIKLPNVETGRMDITYEISEGDISYLDKINIRGNIKTKDKVIRRELAVKPGQIFDMVRVKRSKERLENLGYFSKVTTVPEPTSVPNHKDLAIEVEEQRTGQLVFGAGFSSVDALVGFAEISQSNFDLFNPPFFTGGGQKARLRVQIGTERRDFILSFTEPWFLDRKLALGTDLYRTESQYLSALYNESHTGGDVHLTKEIAPYTSLRLQYGLELAEIYDITDDAPKGLVEAIKGKDLGDATNFDSSGVSRSVSSVTLTLTRDTRDSFLMPTRGNRTELSFEAAGGPFGAQTEIYKPQLRSQQYFPMPWTWPTQEKRHVLMFAGAVGVVSSYGDNDSVPLFDRFFLGGPNNLRGFRYRDVSPKVGNLPLKKQEDSAGNISYNDEPLGGNTYAWGTIEYTIPIIDKVRFAFFYDIGFVNEDSYDFRVRDRTTYFTKNGQSYSETFPGFNDDFGFGLRLDLPIGPIRFDYGIPITSDAFNDRGGRFNFNVGYQF